MSLHRETGRTCLRSCSYGLGLRDSGCKGCGVRSVRVSGLLASFMILVPKL